MRYDYIKAVRDGNIMPGWNLLDYMRPPVRKPNLILITGGIGVHKLEFVANVMYVIYKDWDTVMLYLGTESRCIVPPPVRKKSQVPVVALYNPDLTDWRDVESWVRAWDEGRVGNLMLVAPKLSMLDLRGFFDHMDMNSKSIFSVTVWPTGRYLVKRSVPNRHPHEREIVVELGEMPKYKMPKFVMEKYDAARVKHLKRIMRALNKSTRHEARHVAASAFEEYYEKVKKK